MKNQVKKIGKIIGKILFIICILMLIIEIGIIIQTITHKDKIPNIFGIKPMIVLSGSMETQISVGDLAIVKNIDAKELKEGDIIAFRNGENTVTTHRIVEIKEENGNLSFTTKGDNNNANDLEKVTESQIEGKYIFKMKGIGNFLMYIKEPKGLVAIMILILVIGLIWIIAGDDGKKENTLKVDEKYMKEFEEFKKMKEAERNKKAEKSKET